MISNQFEERVQQLVSYYKIRCRFVCLFVCMYVCMFASPGSYDCPNAMKFCRHIKSGPGKVLTKPDF